MPVFPGSPSPTIAWLAESPCLVQSGSEGETFCIKELRACVHSSRALETPS